MEAQQLRRKGKTDESRLNQFASRLISRHRSRQRQNLTFNIHSTKIEGSHEKMKLLDKMLIQLREVKTTEKLIDIKTSQMSNRRHNELKQAFPHVFISKNLYHIKVEKPIKKGFIDVKAIRVYIAELMQEVNSTIERGEKPYLLIKKAYSPKRGVNEFEVVFMGAKQKHIEELSYFTTHPSEWKSWGEIVLSTEQIEDLIKLLKDLLD